MTEPIERPKLDAKDIYTPPFTGRAFYDIDSVTGTVDISE
jgi:hypothetical protein